jgi:hypothetical protein
LFERSERESSIAKVNPTAPAPRIFGEGGDIRAFQMEPMSKQKKPRTMPVAFEFKGLRSALRD